MCPSWETLGYMVLKSPWGLGFGVGLRDGSLSTECFIVLAVQVREPEFRSPAAVEKATSVPVALGLWRHTGQWLAGQLVYQDDKLQVQEEILLQNVR